MPVSPQDFELYSRMTGAPMPTDAMSRMQMAPDVYNFTKSFARKPNLFEKTGNLVKNIGRGAVMALGAPLVAASEAENARMQEQLRNKADVKQSEAVTMEDPVEEVAPAPELTAVEKGEKAKRETAKFKTDEMIRLEKARAKLRNITDENIETYSIPANPTTADSYGQDYVPNQTATNVVDRKITQGSQIADSTPNIAEVLSETQDSNPVDTSFPVGDARKNMRSVEEIEKNLQEDMETASLTRIGGPEGGVGKSQLAKFLSQKGLDQALLGAIGERMTPEPRIGDSSPLIDHPDLPGGEDDINLPSGTNTSSTEDISGFHKEMRKMEALERMAEQSPSTKQIALGEMNKSREGFMAQDGPNKPAYDAKQRILKKTAEKRKEIEKTKGPSIVFMNAGSGESKEVPISDVNSVEDVKNMTKEVMSPSVNQKSDDFMAKFVEGSQSDIVRGRRGNRSLGITRIPATNGDAQVGFVLANKPLDKSPTTATTYGFGVAPGAEGLLDNQLNQESFSDYMQRGLGEAKEGKKRKAGEIFEFLPPSARVVSGTARLGDIVM